MSFDLDKTLEDMMATAKEILGQEWPDLQKDIKKVLEDEKESLRDIWQARVKGELTENELEEQLADEKEAFQAGLSMVKASSKASVQRIINAVMDTFSQALKAAV